MLLELVAGRILPIQLLHLFVGHAAFLERLRRVILSKAFISTRANDADERDSFKIQMRLNVRYLIHQGFLDFFRSDLFHGVSPC